MYGVKENLQLHDIGVYPSLWRTVLWSVSCRVVWTAVGTGDGESEVEGRLIIFRARELVYGV
jgi:hypothetical protein